MTATHGSRTFEVYPAGVVTSRDDGYLARIPAIGVSGFGDTIPAARERAYEVLVAMLDETARRGGLTAALNRLTDCGIHYEEVHEGHWQEQGLFVEAPAGNDRLLAISGIA